VSISAICQELTERKYTLWRIVLTSPFMLFRRQSTMSTQINGRHTISVLAYHGIRTRPSTLFSDFAVACKYSRRLLARRPGSFETRDGGEPWRVPLPFHTSSLSQTARLEVEYSDTISNVTTCSPPPPPPPL